MKQMMYTVAFRRTATGYKESAFMTDNLQSAYTMASILIKSPAFAHCYAVATDWQGEVVFNLTSSVAAPPPPALPRPCYPPPAPQHYVPTQVPEYRPPVRFASPGQQYYAQQQAWQHGAHPSQSQTMRALPAARLGAPQTARTPVVIDADFEEAPRYPLAVGAR